MQRAHVIVAAVLGLLLDHSLPHQHYFLSKLTILTESGFFSLFQVNKGEPEPAICSCFPELNLRFEQVAFFTFGEAQPLQAMVPDRLGDGKGGKLDCVARADFHPWLGWYQAVIYPLCVSVFRTIKFSKKLSSFTSFSQNLFPPCSFF